MKLFIPNRVQVPLRENECGGGGCKQMFVCLYAAFMTLYVTFLLREKAVSVILRNLQFVLHSYTY